MESLAGRLLECRIGGRLIPPVVFYNGTSQAISFESVTIQAGQLAFHPGPRISIPSSDSRRPSLEVSR